MKFMVTSRKGAAAAVAFLLATPVVALTGIGGGVAQAGVVYGPTASTISGSLFFENGTVGPPSAASTANVQSNNTNTDTFSISLNPASPVVGTPVEVSFSGVTGARTGPVAVNANSVVVRVTMAVSGSNTATLDLTSGSGGTACDYPATRILASSPEGPYTATASYTPSSSGSTTFALKQIYFDDMGNLDGSVPKLCNGTSANADYYASDVAQTACSSCAGATSFVKTAPAASSTIKATVNVVAPTAPGKPSAPTAVAGDGEATVSWSAASDTGGSAITGYTVTAVEDATKTCTPTPATGLTCTVAGLTNDTPYTFTLVASNAIGDSTASNASNTVTPKAPTAPVAPSAPSAVAGDAQATVTWTAPSDNGGSAITGYAVTTVEDPTKTCTPSPATALTCTVTGLTNGTPYTFTLVASNVVGSSVASDPSNAATPATVTEPGKPAAPTAVAGDASATVTWVAATDDGGSAITGYTITAVEDATKSCTPTPATALTCTVTGLTNGTDYTFTLVATNAIGDSVDSDPSSTVTPEGAGPTQDIPSTVTQQVAGVKCQNGIQGVSNWTDGDTGGFAEGAGLTPAPPISDPKFTVALTPAAPTAGQKVTIAVTFDKGITNGPSLQDGGRTRPSARVIVTGALSATIIVNGTPYGTEANPIRQGQRFPGQTMTKANAFTFPADASATNPVFVELQTIAWDTKSQQPDFNWPNGPADTFLTVCNKSASPLTATSLRSPTKKIKAQAAIVPIGVTAAVPFVGEVTPPPTIPPVDDNGGGDFKDTSGGTLPNTGGNPVSSLWVALILFQIGLIMAVRSVRAAPVKTARHL